MFVVIVAFVFGKRECVYEIDRETVVKQNKNRLYVRIFKVYPMRPSISC